MERRYERTIITFKDHETAKAFYNTFKGRRKDKIFVGILHDYDQDLQKPIKEYTQVSFDCLIGAFDTLKEELHLKQVGRKQGPYTRYICEL